VSSSSDTHAHGPLLPHSVCHFLCTNHQAGGPLSNEAIQQITQAWQAVLGEELQVCLQESLDTKTTDTDGCSDAAEEARSTGLEGVQQNQQQQQQEQQHLSNEVYARPMQRGLPLSTSSISCPSPPSCTATTAADTAADTAAATAADRAANLATPGGPHSTTTITPSDSPSPFPPPIPVPRANSSCLAHAAHCGEANEQQAPPHHSLTPRGSSPYPSGVCMGVIMCVCARLGKVTIFHALTLLENFLLYHHAVTRSEFLLQALLIATQKTAMRFKASAGQKRELKKVRDEKSIFIRVASWILTPLFPLFIDKNCMYTMYMIYA